MQSFWTFFLKRHHFTILLTIVLTIAGFFAAAVIPKESSPEIQIPVGIVTTILPGASAEDIEELVTDKIEDRVLGIENVSKVTSTSGSGVSSVTVEFNASADIDKSIQLLKDEVDKAQPELPSEAEDPIVTDVNFADQPIMIGSIAGDYSPAELTAIGEEVEEAIERVEGVSDVTLSGLQEREVQVIVSQARLKQYGLSLSDISSAIRASGQGAPAGSITTDSINYAVRLEAPITDPASVAGIALAGPGGAPLYLRDVADVIDGVAEPSRVSRVSVSGDPSSPALTFSVYKSRGGNIVETGNAIKKELETLQKESLAGTSLVISYDAAKDVEHDLTELSRVGLETVVLVLIMLFVTLGWRESLTAALSIPLSFLIAFIGIYASGNTINFISLFSLILAIGILVDSGIVIVEAIHTRLIATGDKFQAAVASIKEYAWPLIAGTFTTVAVFVPLFFLSGILGKFLASIPFTVIFVLIASIFVALGLIPLFAMYIIRPTLSPIEARQEEINERAKAWYERFLRGILTDKKRGNHFIIGMIALFFVALLLPAVGAVKVVFFPAEDTDLAYVEIETPPGTELLTTDLAVREVEEVLYRDPRIASFVTETGSGSAFGASAGAGERVANVTLNFREDRKDTSEEIIEDLRKELAAITSARVTVSAPEGGPPSGAPLLVTYTGTNLGALAEAAETGARILSDIPGAVNVTTSSRSDTPEFVVRLDTARAAELGVSPASVAGALRGALFASEAASLRFEGEDIAVRAKLDLNPGYTEARETTHVTIDAVRELSIPSARGPVPLSSIATIDYEAANASIRHEDGDRIMTVEGNVTAGANPFDITKKLEEQIVAAGLPEGVTAKVGGESEDVNQSFGEMGLALLAGAALMLAILVLEFNSFRHSLYLLAAIPLSLIGVMVGLMVTGQPLSLPAMLGIIALAGVIINHAIILMDSVARIGRERPDEALEDVVLEAASSRFRPIILTTIVTVVGMIPLSLASAIWGPLAFTIMFGLTFAMALTLVLIPLLYYRWPGKAVEERFHGKIRHKD